MNGHRSYVITPRAERDLQRCPLDIRRRVLDALDQLAATGQGDVRRLSGELHGEWRLRVGDWRVRYRRDAERGVIIVLRVLPRGRAY